jgi:hypothetical protein
MLELLKQLCKEYEHLHGSEYNIHLHSDILDILSTSSDFHYLIDENNEYNFEYNGHKIYLMPEFGIIIEEGKSYFVDFDLEAVNYLDAWKRLEVEL